MTSLESRLKDGEIVILDGAMGTEIQRRGIKSPNPETWSTEGLLGNPSAVRTIHEDYIKAGAEIITANTFSTGRSALEAGGLEGRTAELNMLAVKLAQEARDKVAVDQGVWIAGSMTAMQPWLYPEIPVPPEKTRYQYQEQAELLDKAGVDLIFIEMMIRISDTKAALEAALATGLPTWVGLSCERGQDRLYLGLHGRHGQETIAQAVEVVKDTGVSGMFIMHTLPNDTAQGLRELKEHWSLSIGVYAQNGDLDKATFVSPKFMPDFVSSEEPLAFAVEWDFNSILSPREYLAYAREWVGIGAQIVGGCCGTTPEHIRVLKESLPAMLPT